MIADASGRTTADEGLCMPLTTTAELLDEAVAARRGIAAFNVITVEYAEAILIGAQTTGAPVILQLSENAVRFHGGNPRPMAAAMAELAAASDIRVALHLDHVQDVRLLQQSDKAGFSSVMFDAGHLPYVDNVQVTRSAADWVHAHGMIIEAELGYVGGKQTQASSAHAEGVRTDPQQAADFVAATGVDALAVAVGSSHAMTSRTAVLDADLITRLEQAVGIPLVLHGSSGVSDTDLAAAITAGMRKINIGTILSIAFTTAIKESLSENPDTTDPRKYLNRARESVAQVVADLLRVTNQIQ